MEGETATFVPSTNTENEHERQSQEGVAAIDTPSTPQEQHPNRPPHIVIVGLGAGGIACWKELEKAASAGHCTLTVVEPRSELMWGCVVQQVAQGEVEEDLAWRNYADLKIHGGRYVAAAAVFVEPLLRVVELDNGEKLFADRLIIACGVTVDRERVPGLVDYAFDCTKVDDLRKVMRMLRRPRSSGQSLRILLAAAPGASSCPISLYKTAFLLDNVARETSHEKVKIRVAFPDAQPLGANAKAGAVLSEALKSRGIAVLSKRILTHVGRGVAEFKSADSENFDILVAQMPATAPSFIHKAGMTDFEECLMSAECETCETQWPNVFVIGDIAAKTAAGKKKLFPAFMEIAMQDALVVAKHISKAWTSENAPPTAARMTEGSCIIQRDANHPSIVIRYSVTAKDGPVYHCVEGNLGAGGDEEAAFSSRLGFDVAADAHSGEGDLSLHSDVAYLRCHGVVTAVDRAVQAVLRRKPPKPLIALAEELQRMAHVEHEAKM